MTLFPCICTDYFVFFIPDYQFQKALMIFFISDYQSEKVCLFP